MAAQTTLAQNREGTVKPKGKPRGRPFPVGNNANPGGRPKKDQQLTAALETIVDRRKLGAVLWKLALAGKLSAIKYIYDRIDGTPPQRVQVEINDARVEAERIADDLGLEGDARKEAVDTAVRLLQEARG